MSASHGANRGNPRVDDIAWEEADLESERHLSVGQLQVALRNARGATPKLDVAKQVSRSREDHVDKGDQESNKTDRPGSARRVTGGVRNSISKILGLQNVGALLAARKFSGTKGELVNSTPTAGVWNAPGSGW